MFNVMPYMHIKFKYRKNSRTETDCYNLCMMIAKDRGIILPDINTQKYHLAQAHFIMTREEAKPIWKKVKPKTDTIVAFKINEQIRHVGYMISEKQFIHIQAGTNVQVNSIEDPEWQFSFAGCYEYIGT